MPKLCPALLFAVLSLQSSRACYDKKQLPVIRHLADGYFTTEYGFRPYILNNDRFQYYRPITGSQAYSDYYEGRTGLDDIQRRNKPQMENIFSRNDNPYGKMDEIYWEHTSSRKPQHRTNSFNELFANDDKEHQEKAENRFVLGGFPKTGVFNNRFSPANMFKPFSNLANRIPISFNPNFVGPFDDCVTPNGDLGICASGSVCSLFGGRPSGSCIMGKVCCINSINSCGGTVTLNNTYWQSPPTERNRPTICALNVRLDTKFVEQSARSICQIRLDFVAFSIAQPTAGTCTDKFQVDGASITPPIICGDNSGQHMYLDVPRSDLTSTNIQLMFNFARTASPSSSSWNIRIALLPCGAPYLAPVDCLQYFTSSTGRVKSFNWKDVPISATRQLNNQDYNICFRTELIDRQKATEICFSVCITTNADAGYSITTNAFVAGNSVLGLGINTQGYCTYDFLVIVGATDAVTGLVGDRFCGEKLSATRAPGSPVNVQLCTRVKPFRVAYATDGTESGIVAPALVLTPADTNNVGFCLDYQERVN